MAGPKAPIGSLSRHAQVSAQLAQSKAGPSSRPSNQDHKKQKKTALANEDDSDSDSSSSDDSSTSDGAEALRNLTTPSGHKKSHASSNKSIGGSESKVEPGVSIETTDSEKELAAGKTKQEDSTSSSSSDTSSGSDSDSESDDAVTKEKDMKMDKSAEVAKNGVGNISESESESSSDSDSDSDSESDSSDAEGEGGAKVQGEAMVTDQNAEESTTSSESSSEDESSEREDDSEEDIQEPTASLSNRKPDGPEVLAGGFHLRHANSDMDASDVAQIFAKARTEGKQVWYFTAPSSIPIEIVEKLAIPLERAQKGLPILSHNGDDYGVAFEDAATCHTIKLLIPNKEGDTYAEMNRSVDQAMHLKRIINYSAVGDTITTSRPSIAAKAGRPQPPGLKARFKPIGVSNGSTSDTNMGSSPDSSNDDDDDAEMAEAPPPSSSRKKQKVSETPQPKTKANKRKHAAEEELASASATGSTGRSGQKKKKPRVDAHGSPIVTKDVKVTPVMPPVPPMNGSSASKALSTPAASKTNKSAEAGSSTKAPTIAGASARKESAVPLPPNVRPVSQQPASESDAPVKKKSGREGKGKGKGKDKDKATAAPPAKVTPIAPPVPTPAMKRY